MTDTPQSLDATAQLYRLKAAKTRKPVTKSNLIKEAVRLEQKAKEMRYG